MQKALIWDLVKDSRRFQFLSDAQVEHVVISMAVSHQGQEGIWQVEESRGGVLNVLTSNFYRTFENYQWGQALKAVKTLIREKNILENKDLLLVSHLDELLSRESVHLAKHCHLKQSFLHGALIMPMGNMNFAFRYQCSPLSLRGS